MILFMSTWVEGSTKPHLASKNHIQYALAYLDPTMFDWFFGLLINMKDQLTNWKIGKKKCFIYNTIFVTLFLDQILMRPRVIVPR